MVSVTVLNESFPMLQLLMEEGAFMEERQGWERPGWFYSNNNNIQMVPYDYGVPQNVKNEYREILAKEYSFNFSSFDDIVS